MSIHDHVKLLGKCQLCLQLIFTDDPCLPFVIKDRRIVFKDREDKEPLAGVRFLCDLCLASIKARGG